MSSYVELYMDQGASFDNTINLSDDITNATINLAGYTVTSQMRRSIYSKNASANIVCTIADASNGIVTMTLGSANTANIPAGRYLFDVKANDGANNISRILEGIITVTPQISKG